MNEKILRFNQAKYTISFGDADETVKEQQVTKTEWSLLKYLADHRGRVVSRQDILDNCWPEKNVKENTIEVYVKYIRNKFSEDIIYTRRGFGYMLNEEAGVVFE